MCRPKSHRWRDVWARQSQDESAGERFLGASRTVSQRHENDPPLPAGFPLRLSERLEKENSGTQTWPALFVELLKKKAVFSKSFRLYFMTYRNKQEVEGSTVTQRKAKHKCCPVFLQRAAIC